MITLLLVILDEMKPSDQLQNNIGGQTFELKQENTSKGVEHGCSRAAVQYFSPATLLSPVQILLNCTIDISIGSLDFLRKSYWTETPGLPLNLGEL
jgi:hypothetical protein